MFYHTIPNWIRVLLLVLSFVSFIPQLRHLWLRGDSSGISLYYLLFNLISTTEQFAISFFFIINKIEAVDVFVHSHPPDTGDWLNLSQVVLVWVLWLVVCVLCLKDQLAIPGGSRATVVAIYVAFLFISVVPVFLDAMIRHDTENTDRRLAGALFHGVHSLFLNPVITALSIAALFAQARESAMDALSLVGLMVQAVVFALLAATWAAGRLAFPWEKLVGGQRVTLRLLITWYQLVGWVAVDNAVFAVVQGILFWLKVRQSTRNSVNNSEEQSLLGAN